MSSKRHDARPYAKLRVIHIMIACAITWSFGSMTHFYVHDNRRALHVLATSTPKETSWTTQQQQMPMKKTVYFLTHEQLHINDPFSATWLQPVSSFLHVNISNIKTIEDGCFEVFRTFPKQVRMTLDWIDLSVEHMSKWWKATNVFGNEDALPFNRAVTAFQAYTRSIATHYHTNKNKSPLQATFAIIAFQSYESPRSGSRGRPLTVYSLAATIASLAKVGFGRVVVAGMTEHDKSIVQETYRYLQATLDPVDNSHYSARGNSNDVTRIGEIEVGFVRLSKEQVQSQSREINIPKGALQVLQQGFRGGTLNHKQTFDLFGTTTKKSHWQYIYLSEPDTILQTRISVLPQLKQALDQGFILAPHRLQPIPHETDLMGLLDQHRHVKNTGNFSLVWNLDSDGTNATCCDEQAGYYKPWQEYGDCPLPFWWECGFSHLTNYSHVRLEPYSLIRLEGGTGIVNLAATEHGRRCFPSRNGVCLPRKDSTYSTTTSRRTWYG